MTLFFAHFHFRVLLSGYQTDALIELLIRKEEKAPKMNNFLSAVVLLAVLCVAVQSKQSPPKVQVYSRDPGEFGKPNTLICHVSNFHPPDITIELMKDGNVMGDAKQTDLAFKQDWHFHLTKSAAFTPKDGEKYTCRVTHGSVTKDFGWESNM